MKTFAYSGLDASGRSRKGKMVAADEAALEEALRASGVWLVDARMEAYEAAVKEAGKSARGGVRRQDLIHFCTLMSFLTQVGIPLVQALDIAAHDCDNPALAKTIKDVKRHVESGIGFADALERYPRTFRTNFTSLVRAGESSGALVEAFKELKRYMEWQEQTASEVKQATIYPIIVLICTALFVLVLFSFVVPRFAILLTAVKVELPLPTRIVFGFSDFMKATWYWWMGAMVFGPVTIQVLRAKSHRFAVGWDKFWKNVPVLGPLTHMLWISRFAQNLAVLYRNGVSLIQAMKLCEGLVGSKWVADAIVDMRNRIEAGETVSEAMRRHTVFPVLLVRMVLVGEKTGELDHALENVAGYYNLIVPQRIKKLFSILEPAMILTLVGIVGFVALAVFLPILSLMQSIGK